MYQDSITHWISSRILETHRNALLAGLLFTAAPVLADVFVRDDLITDPKPERFSFCYHGSCAETVVTGLEDSEWQQVREIFSARTTPDRERAAIRRAIALIEQIVGKKTGTSEDEAGTFSRLGEQGQLDCIDESTNTTFYLTMMVNDGLIRWHSVEDRAHRGLFLRGWPHTTAVIRDRHSGRAYAVDSWFLDNGRPPYIIPLEKWQDGWEP